MAEPEIATPPARILIVEDDKGISGMLQSVLKEEGFDAKVANEGTTGVKLLTEFSPDLVLLDLQVPDHSGFDLLDMIRKKDREYGRFIPVIILTGVYTDRNDKINVLNAGADDFLHKPFDLVELLARVRSLIRVRDLYKRSQYLATHDHLTRCYNRGYLMDFLTRECARYERYKSPVAYLLLDLDHFKAINDQLGHEAGDQVLVHVGYILQDFFRAVDCVARLGGDEFAAVLPDCDPENANKVGQRLIESINSSQGKLRLPEQFKKTVGFSVGAACLPVHAKEREELMRKADEAMYAAKNAGRNQFRLAS